MVGPGKKRNAITSVMWDDKKVEKLATGDMMRK